MRYQFEEYMRDGDISWRDAPRYIEFKLPYEGYDEERRRVNYEAELSKVKLEECYLKWATDYLFNISDESSWELADKMIKDSGNSRGIEWLMTVIEYHEDRIAKNMLIKLDELKNAGVFGAPGYDWRNKGLEYDEALAKLKELGYWRNKLKEWELMGNIAKVEDMDKSSIKVQEYYAELEVLKNEVSKRAGNDSLLRKIEENKNKLKLRLQLRNK